MKNVKTIKSSELETVMKLRPDLFMSVDAFMRRRNTLLGVPLGLRIGESDPENEKCALRNLGLQMSAGTLALLALLTSAVYYSVHMARYLYLMPLIIILLSAIVVSFASYNNMKYRASKVVPADDKRPEPYWNFEADVNKVKYLFITTFFIFLIIIGVTFQYFPY